MIVGGSGETVKVAPCCRLDTVLVLHPGETGETGETGRRNCIWWLRLLRWEELTRLQEEGSGDVQVIPC